MNMNFKVYSHVKSRIIILYGIYRQPSKQASSKKTNKQYIHQNQRSKACFRIYLQTKQTYKTIKQNIFRHKQTKYFILSYYSVVRTYIENYH